MLEREVLLPIVWMLSAYQRIGLTNWAYTSPLNHFHYIPEPPSLGSEASAFWAVLLNTTSKRTLSGWYHHVMPPNRYARGNRRTCFQSHHMNLVIVFSKSELIKLEWLPIRISRPAAIIWPESRLLLLELRVDSGDRLGISMTWVDLVGTGWLSIVACELGSAYMFNSKADSSFDSAIQRELTLRLGKHRAKSNTARLANHNEAVELLTLQLWPALRTRTLNICLQTSFRWLTIKWRSSVDTVI